MKKLKRIWHRLFGKQQKKYGMEFEFYPEEFDIDMASQFDPNSFSAVKRLTLHATGAAAPRPNAPRIRVIFPEGAYRDR